MRSILFALAVALGLHATALAAPAKTRVVILGVDHSVQLVARASRAAMLEAFIARVKPDALCVEREPELFAANDHYEFTYEITEVAIPYARREGVDICPFDWAPTKSDQITAFGVDLDTPPPVRKPEGFQGFLAFPDPAVLPRTLFWAEDRTALASWDAFVAKPAEHPSAELSRRLFLYRTSLQWRRIALAARARRGQTLLVVVGANHEKDIESFLAADPAIDLIQAPTFGAPDDSEAARYETRERRLAVLVFNLLGRQADTGNIDRAWMAEQLDALDRDGATAETKLLRLRLALLTGATDHKAALEAYRAQLRATPAEADFTWTGAKDRTRLDSFFDPFAALTVRQRLRLEMARELYALGRDREADHIGQALEADLSSTRRAQFAAYWPMFVRPPKKSS